MRTAAQQGADDAPVFPGTDHGLHCRAARVAAVACILLLGVAMDVIHPFKVFGGFKHPLEPFVMAVALAGMGRH